MCVWVLIHACMCVCIKVSRRGQSVTPPTPQADYTDVFISWFSHVAFLLIGLVYRLFAAIDHHVMDQVQLIDRQLHLRPAEREGGRERRSREGKRRQKPLWTLTNLCHNCKRFRPWKEKRVLYPSDMIFSVELWHLHDLAVVICRFCSYYLCTVGQKSI